MKQNYKIALAGNPNSGKTTLFNLLTGSNQYVGNWPGVTIEKKEGKLKKNNQISIVDLPGIYSLSPYSLEEVVSRDYLMEDNPDLIINIIDGTNLERNLYLTTQLLELDIPMILAINMIDVVNKKEEKIDVEAISKKIGCPVVVISALKGTGVEQLIKQLNDLTTGSNKISSNDQKRVSFTNQVENVLERFIKIIKDQKITDNLVKQRWYAIKIFERDQKIIDKLNLGEANLKLIDQLITEVERNSFEESEVIITSLRYQAIEKVVKESLIKPKKAKKNISEKIDKIVTNRFLALPIFMVVMFLVYFISVTTIGTLATDWVNEGVFGDGWFVAGVGREEYGEDNGAYEEAQNLIWGFIDYADQNGVNTLAIKAMVENQDIDQGLLNLFKQDTIGLVASVAIYDEDGVFSHNEEVTFVDFEELLEVSEPDPSEYGTWVPGIPVLVESGLKAINCAPWLQSLVIDGIIGGVGGVLGFVPQIMMLFILLAFLERSGYMARVAFIMDRFFRHFGLSGKSFISLLIGTGCSVPGIMATRTIENEAERKVTILTTSFIPCSAKLPIIALISGAMFGRSWWVAPSAYFLGVFAVGLTGILVRKSRMFAKDSSPFIMELPDYHLPSIKTLWQSVWERSWSFIKKAGTIILLASIGIWFLASFGITDGSFQMVEMEDSFLAKIGGLIGWLFTPLGWGNWQSAMTVFTGIIAKENVVGTFEVIFNLGDKSSWLDFFTPLAAYSFLVFNLLCVPCFAAMATIRRELKSGKLFGLAVLYQMGLAYLVALWIYQIGLIFTEGSFGVYTIIAIITLLVVIGYLAIPNRFLAKLKKSNA